MEVGGKDAWGCEGHGGCGVLVKEWCSGEFLVDERSLERDCVVSWIRLARIAKMEWLNERESERGAGSGR